MIIDVTTFLHQHNAYVDENNRLHMSVLCDGTLIFLVRMQQFVYAIGCTDIEYNSNFVTEGIPEDKPWCNYRYEVSCCLPDGIIYQDGVLYSNKNFSSSWKDSPLREYLDKHFFDSIKGNNSMNHKGLSMVIPDYTDGDVQYIDTGYKPDITHIKEGQNNG